MKQFKIGIQLYSLREEMAADMEATLAAVKAMGYDYVEFAGYFGKSAEEVKALLDKHGLTAISVHQNPDDFLVGGQAVIDYLKVLGVKYAAIPWYDTARLLADWKVGTDNIAELGKSLKANGIQLLYHNHDFEFQKIDGQYLLDKLYATVPADLLQPEFDTCWVHYAGENPATYLEGYADRKIDVVHLKDFTCKTIGGGPVYELIGVDKEQSEDEKAARESFRFTPVGYGIQDWASILRSCEKIGAEYLIVEQDQWYENNPLDCAAKSRAYLRDTFGL